MFGLGTTELIIVLVIVLIVFGAGKLPQIGDALGKGIRNFKRANNDKEDADSIDDAATKNAKAIEKKPSA